MSLVETWAPNTRCDNCEGATAQNCAYVRRMYADVSAIGVVDEMQRTDMKLDAATALIRIIRCDKTYEEVYRELGELNNLITEGA